MLRDMIKRASQLASLKQIALQRQTWSLCRGNTRPYTNLSSSASPKSFSPTRRIAFSSKSLVGHHPLVPDNAWKTTFVLCHCLPVCSVRVHSTNPSQKSKDRLCSVCQNLDLGMIFEHGINEDRSLAAEEPENGALVRPSPEVQRLWQEERERGALSSLSAEDHNHMLDIARPAIDIGYLDTIPDKAEECALCELIVMAAFMSHPDLFEEDDNEDFVLVDLDERLRCYLLTFPADETQEFRSQDTGPSATYIEIQFRAAGGQRLLPGHHLLQDARDAKPGHNENIPTFGGGGARTRLYNARLIGKTQIDFGLLRSWMHFCEHNHTYPNCTDKTYGMRNSSMSFKVIDVHNRRVIDAPPGCRYLALSYVWGTPLAESLASRKEVVEPVCSFPREIPDTLPRTIEDAIFLVKQLGESFLWVDSLCIDQNSPTDKGSQVRFMDRIYGNAFLTIIAVYGDNADAGLPGVQLHSRYAEGQRWADINGTRVFVSLPSLATELSQNNWNHRGWTYQEGLLSPRCLIFTQSQVYWKCSAELLSESIAEGEDSQRKWVKPAQWYDTFSSPTLAGAVNRDGYALSKKAVAANGVEYLSYAAHVERYTSRLLSFESDALPAFTGILNALSRRSYSKMIWALPDSIFDLALLWKTESRSAGSKGRRPDIPSWSWVSWSGEVTYDREIKAGYVTLGTHALPVNEYWYESADSHKLKIIQEVDLDVDDDDDDDEEKQSAQNDGSMQESLSDENLLEKSAPPSPLTLFLYFEAESAKFTLQATATFLHQFCITPNVSATTAAKELFEPDIGETVWIDDPWDGETNPNDDESEPPRERFVGKEWEFIKMSTWDETEVLQYKTAEYARYKEPVHNVLMIEWKDDTAYRMGMGSIKASIWEKAKPLRKSIKLG